MSAELLTRCGYRCDLCPAYKENIEKDDQRNFLSDTWFKIYGFRISPEKIYCEGCITSDNCKAKLIDENCPVRPCVTERGLENCSQCENYPCEKFDQRKVIYENFSKDVSISRTEYLKCVKPYENKKRIDEIRENNFPFPRLLNPQIVPTDSSILTFLSSKKVKSNFSSIVSFINNSYNLDKKIIFGGKKYGWAIQYKNGKKTIVTIFPERNNFTVLLIFGKKDLDKIEVIRDTLSPYIFEYINKTKHYHDGKWMWLRIGNENYINDIKILIRVKRNKDE